MYGYSHPLGSIRQRQQHVRIFLSLICNQNSGMASILSPHLPLSDVFGIGGVEVGFEMAMAIAIRGEI